MWAGASLLSARSCIKRQALDRRLHLLRAATCDVARNIGMPPVCRLTMTAADPVAELVVSIGRWIFVDCSKSAYASCPTVNGKIKVEGNSNMRFNTNLRLGRFHAHLPVAPRASTYAFQNASREWRSLDRCSTNATSTMSIRELMFCGLLQIRPWLLRTAAAPWSVRAY